MIRSLLYHFILIALISVVAMAQQQSIGTIGVQEATVAGALEITNGRALLVGSTTVTAKDHTAEVTLARGGKVLVCATSGLHVTAGKAASGVQPLMLALDRGAIEVQMPATSSDVVLTPDMRFAIQASAPLDLKLRVTSNGDTCVENRGSNAPLLRITDPFGETTYDLRPGQHVLFEHGSLKEVVDREGSPCGCPPEPIVSVADAGMTSLTPAASGSVVAVTQAEQQFPAAVSQGLSAGAAVPASPPGVVHTQVATTLSYGAGAAAESANERASSADATSGNAAGTISGNNASAANSSTAPPVATISPTAVKAEAPPPPAAPSAPDIAHRIGRFFKRLFGRG